MVKINIISGFLGAGKTTLMKKMLDVCAAGKEHVVVIENEFGKIGIDGELIKKEGFEVYELSSGCICCTLRSDFEKTLSGIIDKLKPDRIIFEPSGVLVLSDVLEILKQPRFTSRCSISSLVTVVDSINYLKYRSKVGPFFNNQIANASILILSKTQLVSAGITAEISADLHEINAAAEIITKNWDDLSHSDILDILDEDMKNIIHGLLHDCHCEHCRHGESHTHELSGSHGFDTLGLNIMKVISRSELEELLKTLETDNFGDVIRAKGFVETNEGYVEFSYINGQYTITPDSPSSLGKVCFIGKNLNKAKLSAIF